MKKPLTALALCALLGMAFVILPSAGRAQDENAAAEAMIAGDAPEEAAEDMAVTAVDDDDEMPPMAQAETRPLPDPPPEQVPPHASRVKPSVSQMQTIDLLPGDERKAVDPQARARPVVQDDYVEPAGETHPTLYLTPDKSTIVRLDRPAAAVMVGNEAHVNVLIDSPTTLVAVPRQPGASYFTVLDNAGRVVMKRHVVIGPAPQYVRVRRSCGNRPDCDHTSVFYCPEGMCHPITTMQRPGSPAPQSSAGVSYNNATIGDFDDYSDAAGNPQTGDFFNFPFIPYPFNMPGAADTGEQ